MTGVHTALQHLLRLVARRPGRACIALLVGTVTIGGALYSVLEKDADWFDGVWWATVTLTTVGYGDYSPESFAGRWLAAFVMAGGIGSGGLLPPPLPPADPPAGVAGRGPTP